VGEGDWHLQFRTTMHNIQIMFERMGVAQVLKAKSRNSQSRLVMRDFKVYLRHPEALPLVQEWLAEETGLAGEDVMFLKADICRAELDLEMEAVVSRRNG
jgi:chorismate lyase/3-hydroxybenzoate synthase